MAPLPTLPRRVINAWGTATPFGVSRCDAAVAHAAADMLQRYVVMAELQALAGERIARWSGAPAACVTHCTAAALTLSAAACIAGSDPKRIAELPNAQGRPRRIPMLAAQQVNYGHSIVQALRLAGALPEAFADLSELDVALSRPGVACIVAVESHLAPGSGPQVTRELSARARAAGVPLVLDCAAQDWRVAELLESGADLVLVSAQKYLRAPTAGVVMGSSDLVAAVDAQHAGIGRGMKPTKEAIAGVIAAIEARADLPPTLWQSQQRRKVNVVAQAAAAWRGIGVRRQLDPQGNGFERLWLAVDAAAVGKDAAQLVRLLRDGDPAVAVAPHGVSGGEIGLELTGVEDDELGELCALLEAAITSSPA
ncbi:MAG: threonine aldolase [Betaproteobacteria bacterium]